MESVLFGVLTDDDGKGALADGLSVGGLPAVVRAKPDAAGVTEVEIQLAGGATNSVGIAGLAALLGRPFASFEGETAKPPPFPAAVGIPDEATARAAALGAGQLLGQAPHRAVREAGLTTLGIMPARTRQA